MWLQPGNDKSESQESVCCRSFFLSSAFALTGTAPAAYMSGIQARLYEVGVPSRNILSEFRLYILSGISPAGRIRDRLFNV